MNELHQDQDSPSDPRLSLLYRQYSSAEPSLEVDRRVLAAARAALADRPLRRRGWWPRWRTPLALATTLALSLTLALLHERPPGELPAERGLARQTPEVQRNGSSTDSLKEARPTSAADLAAPAPAVARPAAAPASTQPEPRAKKARSPIGVNESDGHQAKGQVAAEQALPKASDQAAPVEAKRESLPTAPAAMGAATGSRDEGRLQSAPSPPARAAAPELAKSRADMARSPSVWLEEIRALRREGKVEEAERQLREFRRAHPDYALPDDFRQ